MNLYYQCFQNDYNNYALNHFGGERRSYDRWFHEAERCESVFAKWAPCTNLNEFTDLVVPVGPAVFGTEQQGWCLTAGGAD